MDRKVTLLNIQSPLLGLPISRKSRKLGVTHWEIKLANKGEIIWWPDYAGWT
jgi:hypothetical protein